MEAGDQGSFGGEVVAAAAAVADGERAEAEALLDEAENLETEHPTDYGAA